MNDLLNINQPYFSNHQGDGKQYKDKVGPWKEYMGILKK